STDEPHATRRSLRSRPPGRRRRAGARVPVLRHAAPLHVRGPREQPAVPERRPARGPQPGGGVLPPPRVRLRALLPRPARRVLGAGGHLLRVRLFLVVLDLVAGPRAPLRGPDDG